LVEQGTFNPKVAGSIPARPITKGLQGHGIRFLRRLLLVARVRFTDCAIARGRRL
jgi:hypothetical protein